MGKNCPRAKGRFSLGEGSGAGGDQVKNPYLSSQKVVKRPCLIFGRIQGLLLLNRTQEEKLLGNRFKSERIKLKFYM